MFKALQGAIIHYSALAVVPPLILAAIYHRKYSPALKVLSLHLLMVAVFSGVAVLLSEMKRNNLPLLHVYTICEFIMIIWFYSIVLRGFLPAKLLVWIAAGFTVFALMNSLLLQSWYTFNTIPRSIEGLVVILLSLVCYYRMLSELKIRKMERSPIFWINTGFLFYFSGALFLFMLSNYILPLNHQLNIFIWTIHACFSIMLYLFIFLGLCNHRNA
jgi:hypothetical protein